MEEAEELDESEEEQLCPKASDEEADEADPDGDMTIIALEGTQNSKDDEETAKEAEEVDEHDESEEQLCPASSDEAVGGAGPDGDMELIDLESTQNYEEDAETAEEASEVEKMEPGHQDGEVELVVAGGDWEGEREEQAKDADEADEETEVVRDNNLISLCESSLSQLVPKCISSKYISARRTY